jgi:N-glycosidase YbiA
VLGYQAMDKINIFSGKYRWLSNFYVNPNDGFCVEKHYQAAKATNEEDRAWILSMKRPGDAKAVGRAIQIRLDWDKVKVEVMLRLLRQKFANPVLRAWLLETGESELVEGNWWGDTFWGVCNGKGQNMLGKLLMLVRSELGMLQEI